MASEPLNPEADPAQMILASQRGAVATAVGSLDADPEAAARSMELSGATGVPAPVINSNLEGFEQQHKATLTAQLLNSNEYLQRFINSNPMAAKVANDDYANLDDVSQKVSNMNMGFGSRMLQTAKNSLSAMMKPPEGYTPLEDSVSAEDLKNHPFLSAMYLGLGEPINMLLAGMQDAVHSVSEGARKVGEQIPAIGPESLTGKGVTAGRDFAGLVEAEAMGLTGRHGGMPEVGAEASRAQATGSLFNSADMEKLKRVQPYLDSGREPPHTALPEYDDFRTDQNADDVAALKEATSAAQSSALRERSPDMFADFIKQHTDAEIGISGDAVASLYGDKVSDPTDNLLGWVPNIADKLELARSTGSDVSVPLADWLAHAEPDLMTALHDDIRVRPNGITKNEANITKEQLAANPSESLAGEVPQTRAASALEPLFSVGDRKLELQRLTAENKNAQFIGRDPKELAINDGLDWDDLSNYERQRYIDTTNGAPAKFGVEEGFHDFSMIDEKGNPVGTINLYEDKAKKQLYVDMINGINGLGPKDFGPSLMRDLLRQLKQEFPNAESITGHRVSGAREKAGSYMAKSASPVVKLDNPNIEHFTDLLEGGQWEEYAQGIHAYIKPYADRYPFEKQLINTVAEELDRIAPNKLQVQPADRIVSQDIEGQHDEPITPTGAYIPYRKAYPILLYALEGDEPLGVARHEAIHHLRNYGFFKPEEWSTLEKAATEQGWMDKFHIQDRYPTGDHSLHLEEAIADAYKDWATGAEAPSPEVHGLFQRMKQFFTALKDRIATLLGKDPTWEDIFKKVDAGEVGGREGTEPLDARAFNEKLSVPEDPQGGSRVFERASALGMTVDQFRRYDELMQQRHAEDVANATKRAESEVAREHTKQWKEDRKALRVEVSEDIKQRPDVAADLFFGNQELYGKKVPLDSAKMDGSTLTEVQKAGLPKQYYTGTKLETVESAAVKINNKIYIGVNHLEALEKAAKELGTDVNKIHTKTEDTKQNQLDAWITSRGRFVDSKEAAKIVNSPHDKLDSSDPEFRQQKQSSGGLHPDDVANLFGYGSGDVMIERLIQYNAAKLAANMSAKDFVSRVTDIETDRQMRIRHGDLGDNIIDAVKEQVTGQTQQDILHEETVALGMKSGQAPLDKAAIVQQLKDNFAKMPLGSVSSDAYMRAAGKAGRQAEISLLENDPANAFKAKQQQYYATVIANEAAKLERDIAKFDKLAKRFSKREVPAVDQQYTNFIHDILMRVGKQVRRSVQDLETEVNAGEYKDLQSFVEGKNGFYLREVAVADQFFDPNFRKAFDDLTVDEFRATDTSVKSLLVNGRDEKKITKAGVEADLNEIKGQMLDQLKEFQAKTYDAKGGRWMGPIPPRIAKVLRTYGTAHIQMENLFNRWDHDNPQGVFQQYVMRDLVDAANNESVMEKRYASKLRDIDDKADLKKGIDNSIFKVPGTEQVMQMTRANLRTILLNAGNTSNLSKMARGYKLTPEVVRAWIDRHATKEDWDWAQKMGDVFAELKGESDVMYRNLSGVAAESIRLDPVDTPHGQYSGWYYPLIAHPEFEGGVKKMMGKDSLEQEGFVRATTANGYTKARTNVAYPLALDLDALAPRMKQMIHDIAMRPSIINASKIFYDKDIRGSVFNRFGAEWRDMMIPYLVDVANSANYMPKEQRIMANASEFIRQNLISTLVGLNPGTVLKHGPTALVQSLHEVGPAPFLKAMKSLFSINDRTGETNWQFAMKTSEELQRRHQNYVETLGGSTELLQPKSGFASLRNTVQRFSASPVAISDLLSAVPTWLAQYEKTIGDGETHGDSVYMADRAVRRAHGSVAVTNRSSVMRGGALSQWFASVYGFFNHIMNRQYELLWKSGETLDMVKDGNYDQAMQRAPELTSMLFAYVLAPALIEEVVTPLMSSENESWGKKAAKGVAYTLGASWVGIRDIANAILNGRDPAIGLMQTSAKSITDFARDLAKDKPLSKEHAGKVVRDGATLMGALTGVVPSQVGKTAQFGMGVADGQERPKGPWGWLTGARFGTLKNHPSTFQEWQRHHLGVR